MTQRLFTVGMVCVGLGVLVAVVVASEPISFGLVVLGLVVAYRALMKRERSYIDAHPQPRRTNKFATLMMVIVAGACGFLAAGANEMVWFGTAIFCGFIIWWLRPGMMSSSDR